MEGNLEKITLGERCTETEMFKPLEHATGETGSTVHSATLCGVGRWRPGFMQIFANMKSFVALSGPALILTQSLAMYFVSQLTTLEKQFRLSSSVSGFLSTCNDIGYLLIVLLISHFGRNSHKPRILGYATVLFGISALMTSMTYFLVKPPEGVKELMPANMAVMAKHLCRDEEMRGENASRSNSSSGIPSLVKKSGCNSDASDFSGPGLAIFLIAVGMMLQGMAKTPRFPLTTAYVDDNVRKTDTAVYLGVFYSMMKFAPALAFTLGSVFSGIYVHLNDPGFGVRDHRWIGAWWLGYMVFGAMAILSSIPLFCFPKRLKSAPSDTIGRQKYEPGSNLSFREKMKDFLPTLVRLLRNPVYACCLTASATRAFGYVGASTFIPKYIEVHFSMPTWKVNLILGSSEMVSCALATIASGIIVTKMKLGVVGCAKMLVICLTLSVLANAILLMISCPQRALQGHDNYQRAGSTAIQNNTVSDCAVNCGCINSSIFPVCGSDGINYASPCHGGCQNYTSQGLTDCSCIGEGRNGTATAEYCTESSCASVTIFLVILTINSLAACQCFVPNMILAIRCIEERDKAPGAGLIDFVWSVAGYVSAPVAFGWMIDRTCIFWTTSCGKTGSCALYNIRSFRVSMFGMIIFWQVIATLLFVLCIYLASKQLQRKRRTGRHDQETDEKEQNPIFMPLE